MDSERRQAKRKEISLRVKYQSAGRQEETQTRDISIGGLFIKSVSPPPEGARIRLSFTLPDGYTVEVEGTIAHRLRGVGMGVAFDSLNPETEARICEFVDS
jgi:uncharacterized protein (TIGR02266 family)